jgi:hypothetical protein
MVQEAWKVAFPSLRSLSKHPKVWMTRSQQPSAGAHGWKLVVDDFNANELCSATDIFNIQMKSKYMSLSLRFALVEMNAWKWRDCCNEAVKELKRLEGHRYITSGKTVMIWHHAFRL